MPRECPISGSHQKREAGRGGEGRMDFDRPVGFRLEVPCQHAHAFIVKEALQVDKELSPEKVTRDVAVEGNLLVVAYRGVDLRSVRVAVHSTLQVLALALETVAAFADIASVDAESLSS
ncbi:EKC/KEOPS complex subunit SPAC4H3.13 [Diplonema papillatum]|nr:EKC/KEOPS complex subunit SPAC4H3.13 [Diplonema papillatum]